MKNRVQLITYVDRLGGGGIAELASLLRGPLKDLFAAIHILPFYFPIDGADAGFDPIDHTRIDPQLGNWADLESLTQEIDVMADVIVNHLSAQSPQFVDFLQKGAASQFDGLFLTRETVFAGAASAADLALIYRPRPGTPFTTVRLQTGEERVLWTTFTPEQIDIDVMHPQGTAYLSRILSTLSEHGIRMVRLDAVGYAVKKPGTDCFMLPETFDFIATMAAHARALDMETLVEIHAHYRRQIEIAAHVDWVYDFALPPLILHAFEFRTARNLKQWVRIRPTNALTVLDTHDGIGIMDIGPDRSDPICQPGLLLDRELDELVERIHRNSQDQSRRATGAAASNLDVYQVNCTFYDAMGRKDLRYLLARAIQFFLPGIPQVYYVGLLAGSNDMDLLAHSNIGRDINRHYYRRPEIEQSLRRPVTQDLLGLIRLRNSHAAFGGVFQILPAADECLHVRWDQGEHFARLRIDFFTTEYELCVSAPNDKTDQIRFAPG